MIKLNISLFFNFLYKYQFICLIIILRYSIPYPDAVRFSWLFASDNTPTGIDEVRIYEILVTNTNLGGSDRCASCLTINEKEME